MPKSVKIAFSNDHAASDVRDALVAYLRELGHEVTDYGERNGQSVDYPDMALPAVRDVAEGRADRAVLVCGSGIGMSIVANRFPGVRCAMVTDEWAAEMSRRHNDANCIAIRAREQSIDLNKRILDKWLMTPFEGGRHQPRIDKIESVSGPVEEPSA